MRRINVIGTSCSGKSTFARKLAAKLDLQHVELDHVNWEPGWIEVGPEVFRQRALAAVAGESWVVDGNYRIAREIIWPIADTLIWLDYPLRVVVWRSIKRSISRVIFRQTCCNGNRESIRRALSRDSIILWVLQTHRSRHRNFQELLPKLASAGAEIVVLRSPRAAEQWILKVTAEVIG